VRIGKGTEGKTSPEELLAAAHAACFATSLAGELTRAGSPPERLDVKSNVVMDEVGDRGHLIVASELRVRARVAGIDTEAFDRVVEEAHDGCPFSSLIRASAKVSIDAELEVAHGN
jgi:lipoyl-dependent peroxiredoxin